MRGQWKGSKAEDEIVEAFDLAARWKAVLLIDECDLYLEKRSGHVGQAEQDGVPIPPGAGVLPVHALPHH